MAEATVPKFNLVDDSWIMVVMCDGIPKELSLREAFRMAPQISYLTGDIPQQSALVLRLMEAILYRAYFFAKKDVQTHPDMIELWQEIWGAGVFDGQVIDVYLDKYRERFSLFGETPFMQVPGLKYVAKECDPVSEMVGDVPKPDKFLFSMRTLNAPHSLSFAEAARWLLWVQGYDCAGIMPAVAGNTRIKNGKVYPPKGLPGMGWSGSIGTIYVEGATLFETLLLNFVMFDESFGRADCFGVENDVPSWEKSDISPDDAAFVPSGVAGLFSVGARRVRLVPSGDGGLVTGVVKCYGDTVRPTEAKSSETMTSWRESKEQQKKLGLAKPPLMPRSHDCSKALWRGLGPLVARSQEVDKPDLRPGVIKWIEVLKDEETEGLPKTLRIHAQGVEYGSQSSVITNSYDDVLDLGDVMLRTDSPAVRRATGTVTRIEEAVGCLVNLVSDLRTIAADTKTKTEPRSASKTALSEREKADVKEQAFLALDSVARGYLREFSADLDPVEHCKKWAEESRHVLCRIANDHLLESPVSRFAYRGKDGQAMSVDVCWRRFVGRLNRTLGLEGGPLTEGGR